MTGCSMCGDRGLVVLNWNNAPPDFAVCLCRTGLRMREERNNGTRVTPLWAIWCQRWGIAPSRMFLIEEALTADELRADGLISPPAGPHASREAALLQAGKRSSRRG